MLGNFTYDNPTRIHFGPDAMEALAGELAAYGPVVQLVYGGGSIKKNGIYDQVIEALAAAGKTVVEDAGVMPNPTVEKLNEGIEIGRNAGVDLILAVGGGSVIDYAKAVSVSIHCDADPWQHYFVDFADPTCEIVPVGSVLTMVGTGSEMNGGSVITNHATHTKVGHVFGPNVNPRFSILNPTYTLTLPAYQMVSGIYDAMNHVMEQYFSGDDDNTSDYLAEGLMRSLVHSGSIAVADPQDYEARSNIMWDATLALNTLISRGKPTDWMVHMIAQGIAGHTNSTHGHTLAAVSLPYYRRVAAAAPAKFARFSHVVFDIDAAGKTDEQLAGEGLEALAAWMDELGLARNLTELGATPEMVEDLTDSVIQMDGGYLDINRQLIVDVITESL